MGKIIYSFSVSLDGYFETVDHGLEWAIIDEEFHTFANEETRETAVELYGRRLYELMSDFWPTADEDPSAPAYVAEFARMWREKPKVVFSKTLEKVDWNSRLVRGNVVEEVEKLKGEYDGDMNVGGAELAATFARLDLIDEYRVYIHPVILGDGTPYLPMMNRPIRL
ncbi:MAG: dihydrofolate reductase family protein, partial [Candidatus Promineifilaceae bacterium]